ncbi:molybdenum cofactor guanylyltransferase [Desulfosporosinus hippei]
MRRSSKINTLKSEIQAPKLQATGVLLAGGKSSRMKKDKAFLEIEGQSLAERSLKVLKTLFPEVLISSNRPELFTQYELPVIGDEVIGRGPLEGLYQGLKAAKHDVVFFVACDMPFLEIELIRFLARWSLDYDVVVPKLQSGLHPLHAFYHRRCLSAIKNNLEADRLKIIDFYPVCSAKYVDEKEMGRFSDLTKAFCNVNTPEEWSHINKTITPI